MKIINKKIVILSSISVIALLISINTQAKIYKWTDANGQTHYTAQPPQQKKQRIKATNIEAKIKSNAGKYRPEAKSTKTAAGNSENEGTDENKSEDGLSGPDKKLTKYCDGQRNNLKQLKKNFRNVWIDAEGKRTNLNQEQRKVKVAKLQDEITNNCSEVKVSDNS